MRLRKNGRKNPARGLAASKRSEDGSFNGSENIQMVLAMGNGGD